MKDTSAESVYPIVKRDTQDTKPSEATGNVEAVEVSALTVDIGRAVYVTSTHENEGRGVSVSVPVHA